jgi:DNA-binding Xre family transcriptional regulator
MTKLDKIRKALKHAKNKKALAEKIGVTPDGLHKIQTGFIRDPKSSVVDALCRELNLDPATGDYIEPTGIKAFIPESERQPKTKRVSVGKEKHMGNGGDDDQILPESLTLTREEAKAIMFAREKKLGSLEARVVLETAEHYSYESEAIFRLFERDYVGAAKACMDLIKPRR